MTELASLPLARRTLAELGEQDYDAADFFEAYANAIEEQAAELKQAQSLVTHEVRHALIDLIAYFDGAPESHYQYWPHLGLRALAMLAPRYVASGILGVSEELLGAAIRSQRPNKSWGWWRALGVAILAGATLKELQAEFGLGSVTTARKYMVFLIGPLEAAVRSVA